MKIISKVLSTRIKDVIPFLISSNQAIYLNRLIKRLTRESGTVISDILEIANALALEGFLETIDIEKGFDFVNHCFLLQFIRKFRFGIDFVSWIKTISRNQESCINNGGKQNILKVERGARQGNPISVYLFILF